jgi:hypothetical protein
MSFTLLRDEAVDLSNSPSKIKPEWDSEESFLGDVLSERSRDRIGMKALSLMPCALPALSQTLSIIEGSFVEGSLTQGHGLHHRCNANSVSGEASNRESV